MDEAASALRLEAIEQRADRPGDGQRCWSASWPSIQAEKEAAALAEDYERAAKLRQRELKVQSSWTRRAARRATSRR